MILYNYNILLNTLTAVIIINNNKNNKYSAYIYNITPGARPPLL